MVKNRGGHSSLPTKDNAIYHLAEGLDAAQPILISPNNLNDTTRGFFERSAEMEQGKIKLSTCGLLWRSSPTQRRPRVCQTRRHTMPNCVRLAWLPCWREVMRSTLYRKSHVPVSIVASCPASALRMFGPRLFAFLADDQIKKRVKTDRQSQS